MATPAARPKARRRDGLCVAESVICRLPPLPSGERVGVRGTPIPSPQRGEGEIGEWHIAARKPQVSAGSMHKYLLGRGQVAETKVFRNSGLYCLLDESSVGEVYMVAQIEEAGGANGDAKLSNVLDVAVKLTNIISTTNVGSEQLSAVAEDG